MDHGRPGVSDVISDQFDKQEARVIAKAPVLVFLLVSAADGTIDKQEIRDFEAMMTSAPYGALLALMEKAKLSIIDTLRQLTENPIDYIAELERIGRVLDTRLTAADAQQVKAQLYDLGHSIAKASGRFLEQVGDPVSDQERTALKVIAGLFGIDHAHR